MTALAVPVTADTCPLCGFVHGQLDLLWACPVHGHRLGWAGKDMGWDRYTCPVQACRYERSAPPPGDPMTTAISRPSKPTDLMWSRREHFAAILPPHLDVKAFLGTAAAALYADPQLMAAAEGNPESFITTLLRCAAKGHQPGTDEYYLTWRMVKPRGGGAKRPTIVGIEGYRGIIERMYRSGAVASVVVREVCATDRFRYTEGQDDVPLHTQGGGDALDPLSTGADFFGENGSRQRGPMVGVYAYARLVTGAVSRVVLLSRDDVMAAKAASDAGDSEHSPWNRMDGGAGHPEFTGRSMWWKTAARRLEPWVPTSSEYQREMARATAVAADVRDEAPPPALDHAAAALPPPEPARGRRPAVAAGNGGSGLRDQIGDEFARLGIDDPDERDNILRLLTGADTGPIPAEPGVLGPVLQVLKGCGNVGEVQAHIGALPDD